jgi:hypothetical protein
MRRRIVVIGVLSALLLGAGLAFADSDLPDKTPIGATEQWKERAAEEFETAFAGTLDEGGGSGGGESGPTVGATGDGSTTFFPEQGMPCDVAIEGPLGCAQALEPEVKSGPDGTIYVTAQEGTPAGVMAWRRDPATFEYKQLAKPDRLPRGSEETSTTGGGGDNELAIGTPDPDLGGAYRVYVSSLNSLVTNGVAVSTDRGDTWNDNKVASSFVGVDRQWLAAYGPKTAYLSYHEIGATSVLMTKTTDGGTTWGPPMEMFTTDTIVETSEVWFGAGSIGTGNLQSNMIALPDGGVAFAYARAAAGTSPGVNTIDGVDRPEGMPGNAPLDDLWIAITNPGGTTVENIRVGRLSPNAIGLFPAIAVDAAGNLYVTATNRHGVFLATSTDRGATWSPLHEVTASAREANTTTVFPYVVAGSAGRAALAWLGTTAADTNTEDAVWTVQYASSFDVLAAEPTFNVMQASTKPAHAGRVCLSGLSCSLGNPIEDGRSLAEVLQMGITKDGRAMIAYPENFSQTHVGAFATVVEQNGGPGLYADIVPVPPIPPPANGPRTVTGVVPNAERPYFFTNRGDGERESDGVLTKPGYRFDGMEVFGEMEEAPGTKGHVGVIGYAANSTPGVAKSVMFAGPVLEQDTIVGGNLDFTLYIQNELGEDGATELDFTLYSVSPEGRSVPIAAKAVQEGPAVAGGAEPTKVDLTVPMRDTWLLPQYEQLVLVMSFPYLVSSATRFYYGDATYPSGLKLHIR